MNKIKDSILNCLFVAVLFGTPIIAQDNKTAIIIKEKKILSGISFDRVVLYTLIAFENNYKFKKKFLPLIHVDDYYTLILNTAKRLALSDTSKIQLPGNLMQPASKDSTKNKE